MNRILTTFPGRFGDLLWALPTIRAISEQAGAPVDLQIAGEFAPILDLLRTQPYLGNVWALPSWSLTPPDEWQPPRLGSEESYDRVYHLGYRGWPEEPLPMAIARIAHREYDLDVTPELRRPWITAPYQNITPAALATAFTEAWFELKLGLVECLSHVEIAGAPDGVVLTPPGSRWDTEAGFPGCTWVAAAWLIARSTVVLADCSALHVLAVALGKPVLLYEPMEARWNPIFYPLGMDGPEVTMIRGGDGKPTIDARHTAEYLRKALEALRAR